MTDRMTVKLAEAQAKIAKKEKQDVKEIIKWKEKRVIVYPPVALTLLFPILALAGCCSDPIVIRPSPAMITPVDDYPLTEGDTVRDLAEKYELRGLSIEEANKRFKKLRE